MYNILLGLLVINELNRRDAERIALAQQEQLAERRLWGVLGPGLGPQPVQLLPREPPQPPPVAVVPPQPIRRMPQAIPVPVIPQPIPVPALPQPVPAVAPYEPRPYEPRPYSPAASTVSSDVSEAEPLFVLDEESERGDSPNLLEGVVFETDEEERIRVRVSTCFKSIVLSNWFKSTILVNF